MKSFAIVSLLTTTALAASSVSNTSSSSSENPLIPSGISDGCNTFLTNLNTDSALAACTTPMQSATSAYGPNGNTSTTPSVATISNSLNTLCSSSIATSCSKSMLSGKLASFAQACSAELVSSPVTAVRNIYDTLYMLSPFWSAVCCKDDNGQYCATESSASTTAAGSQASAGAVNVVVTPKNDDWQQYLWTPAPTAPLSRRDSVAMIPNTTTYASSNIAFLLREPSLSESLLCTTCTRNILTSYIGFETDVPHAYGVAQSSMLGGQTPLYTAVQSKCGANFLSGAVQAAGGIAGGILSGAPRTVGGDYKGTIAVMLGVVSLGYIAIL